MSDAIRAAEEWQYFYDKERRAPWIYPALLTNQAADVIDKLLAELRECHERERRLLDTTEAIEAQRNMTMLPLPSAIRERADAHEAILEAARRRRDSDNPPAKGGGTQ